MSVIRPMRIEPATAAMAPRQDPRSSEHRMDIERLLQLAIDHGASDLHLSGGNPPMVRVDGEIRPLDAPPLAGAEIEALVTGCWTKRSAAPTPASSRSTSPSCTPRAPASGSTPSTIGPAPRRRSAPYRPTVPSLDQLEAPWVLKRIAGLGKGLVLVTGPTGSGKSTTLAALIERINATASRHILTIEDPIEFVHRSKRSLINQREVGRDTRSFARALRSALRADPDVILVGELRDYETIALALTAAETGHLVLATLHTTSAAKTIDRLIDVVPSADKAMVRTMLSSSLQAVIAQLLLKRAEGGGRLAAYEVLIGTPAVANLIRENQIAQITSMIQTGARFGMQLMTDALRGWWRPGGSRPRRPSARSSLSVRRPTRWTSRRCRANPRHCPARDQCSVPVWPAAATASEARAASEQNSMYEPRTGVKGRRGPGDGPGGPPRACLLAAALLLGTLAACKGTFPVMDHDRYAGLTRDDYRAAFEPRPVPPAKAAPGAPIPMLQPLVELPPPPSPAEQKLVSISVDETVPLKDVLIELTRKAQVDLELDPRISGGVILTMRNRPLREVIERIADLAGLRYEFQGQTLRIERDEPYHVNYRVDYLLLTRQANSQVETSVNVMAGGEQATSGNASSSAISGQSDTNFWQELEAGLSQILGNSTPPGLAVVPAAAPASPAPAPSPGGDPGAIAPGAGQPGPGAAGPGNEGQIPPAALTAADPSVAAPTAPTAVLSTAATVPGGQAGQNR